MKARTPYTHNRLVYDAGLYFFGLGSLACLSVSIPATASAMQLVHPGPWGGIATGVFELGAVGSELMTLAIPQWRKRLMLLTIALLVATTMANYALGADELLRAQLAADSTYAAIRAAGAGWLLAVALSALFPLLLFVFLLGFTARWRMVAGRTDRASHMLLFWLPVLWSQAPAELERLKATLEQMRIAAERTYADLVQARNTAEQTKAELAQARLTLEQEQARAEQAMTLLERIRTAMEQAAVEADQERTRLAQTQRQLEQERQGHRETQLLLEQAQDIAVQIGTRTFRWREVSARLDMPVTSLRRLLAVDGTAQEQ